MRSGLYFRYTLKRNNVVAFRDVSSLSTLKKIMEKSEKSTFFLFSESDGDSSLIFNGYNP